MKRFVPLLFAPVVLAALVWMNSAGQAQPELQNVMKAKLQHVHRVVDGLALEDFDRIQRAAQALGTLSRADAWNLHKTPEYVKFSKDFQDLADTLAADAKAKRLEACTLDYVQMTMLCVKCHTHTRKIGVALAEPVPPALTQTR
jgi:hypothetical protein